MNNSIDDIPQNQRQLMVTIAQGELAPVVIEMLRLAMVKRALVADDQWNTLVNTITMDAQSNMIQNVIQLLEDLRASAFIK